MIVSSCYFTGSCGCCEFAVIGFGLGLVVSSVWLISADGFGLVWFGCSVCLFFLLCVACWCFVCGDLCVICCVEWWDLVWRAALLLLL